VIDTKPLERMRAENRTHFSSSRSKACREPDTRRGVFDFLIAVLVTQPDQVLGLKEGFRAADAALPASL
jgi:hypothetical protein